ncbi:hypothetical protein J6590_035840 [Homalodisca vitripennis]|nr:hypothetical protein J6590_035840 [Homalodisca vitripennis]
MTLPSGNGDPYLTSVPVISFNFAWKLVTVEEVVKVVHGFKSSGSCSNRLNKLVSVRRRFPEVLKVSRTVNSTRRVQKTSIDSFMMEQLCNVFHHLLVPAQFGFRRHRSTVVESLLQIILKYFEAKRSTAVLLCDLLRSFECVAHKILIKKLERYDGCHISENLFGFENL